MEERGLTET
jgi:hypothetical protein